MKGLAKAGLVIGALFAATSAQASTTSANLNVNASVTDTCSAADATMAFGPVNLLTGVLPTTGLINVTCSLGTSFSVGLGDGLNPSGGERRMKRSGSSDYLIYKLFKDALSTARFGDTGYSDRVTGALGLGIVATPISVFGSVPSGQNTTAGSYSDVVQITVYY